MRLIFLFPFLFTGILAVAQEADYQALLLDSTLTDNADAVVRLDRTEVVLHSNSKMTVIKQKVVTVLNQAGRKSVKNYAHYNSTIKLEDLQVFIYNANGSTIEKIKKKEFKDISAVSGGSLYEDSRIKYFKYVPTSYPYTIDFLYSYQTSNTAFIPHWSPVDEYMVSTEKSEFKLTFPEEIKIRTKEKNFETYSISNKSSRNKIHYEVLNIPASKREMLSPPFYTIEPRLLLGLDNFHLEGIDGQGADWTTFGKWQYDNLLKDRDALPPATIAKMKKLLDGINDPLEKAKKVYEYVQNNTRYISVQLGIGGWMPIEAAEVDRVKYGDCKGLTNYTKALLKSQGVESYYSVVWAGKSKRNIEVDFASMQGNHVILNIPNENGDVWLECTSQKIPFGFLGNFTDDRDVLVITPEGGTIKHTPIYGDDHNKKVTKADYTVTSEGHLKAKVAITSQGIQYDSRSEMDRLPENKKETRYKKYWSNINGLKIADIKLSNSSEEIKYIERIKLEAPSYASIAGDDMLFEINPFDANKSVPDRYRNRKQPFEISRGYVDEDEYVITLPENYVVTDLPDPIAVDSKYGSYHTDIEQTADNKLIYKRKLLIRKGEYSKDEYSAYRDFRRTIAKNDNQRIVLTK